MERRFRIFAFARSGKAPVFLFMFRKNAGALRH
jgi:hypothetical protein